MEKNSLLDWKPVAPTRLFHGTADEVIPYKNSQDTYNKFKEFGASDVDFILIQGGNHGNSFSPMMHNVFPWFEELNKTIDTAR